MWPASEMVNLVLISRAYDANQRVITTRRTDAKGVDALVEARRNEFPDRQPQSRLHGRARDGARRPVAADFPPYRSMNLSLYSAAPAWRPELNLNTIATTCECDTPGLEEQDRFQTSVPEAAAGRGHGNGNVVPTGIEVGTHEVGHSKVFTQAGVVDRPAARHRDPGDGFFEVQQPTDDRLYEDGSFKLNAQSQSSPPTDAILSGSRRSRRGPRRSPFPDGSVSVQVERRPDFQLSLRVSQSIRSTALAKPRRETPASGRPVARPARRICNTLQASSSPRT